MSKIYNEFKREIELKTASAYLESLVEALPILPQEEFASVIKYISILKDNRTINDRVKIKLDSRRYFKQKKNANFDYFTAQKTRIDAGYKTLSDLTRALFDNDSSSVNRATYSLIAQYESGHTNPKNPPKVGSVTEKYVLWLKDNGYDPFNLGK